MMAVHPETIPNWPDLISLLMQGKTVNAYVGVNYVNDCKRFENDLINRFPGDVRPKFMCIAPAKTGPMENDSYHEIIQVSLVPINNKEAAQRLKR